MIAKKNSLFITLMQGLILPINFNLWPTRSMDILMALITKIDGEVVTLCPVHNQNELAAFYDLVIPKEYNSLGCQLVVMSDLKAGMTLSALNERLFLPVARPSSPSCLNMSEAERAWILSKLELISQQLPIDHACNKFRGSSLLRKGRLKQWRRRFSEDWQALRAESLLIWINNNKNKFPEFLQIQSVINMFNRLRAERVVSHENVVLFYSRINNARHRQNQKRPPSMKDMLAEDSVISKFQHQLGCVVAELNDPEKRLNELLTGNIVDLLELAVRLYSARSGCFSCLLS